MYMPYIFIIYHLRNNCQLLVPIHMRLAQFLLSFGATATPSPPPTVGQGLLIHEVSISHTTTNDAPQSVEFLWTSDQLVSDFYLTIYNAHNRQTSMPPAGFEPTISAD